MKVGFSRKGSDIGGPFVFVRRLSRYLLQQKIEVTLKYDDEMDIFIVVAGGTITYEKAEQLKKRGIKVIIRVGGVYTPMQLRYNSKLATSMHENKEIMQDADWVVYNTQYVKSLADQFLAERNERFSIIYNGIDLSVFAGISIDSQQVKGNPAICSVAHWRSALRVLDIVNAMPYILERYPDACFTFIGKDNGTMEQLRSIMMSKGVEKSLFNIGNITQRDLGQLLPQFDIFLHTEFKDEGPNVVAEALASGLPVIGGDCSAVPELIRYRPGKRAGVVVPYHNTTYDYWPNLNGNEIAQAVRQIWEHYDSYTVRARKRGKQFSMNVIGQKYVKLFQSLIK